MFFAQNVLFHWFCYHSIRISALWLHPAEFFAFWLPKIASALFLASLLPLFKRKGWFVIVYFLMTLWVEANLMFFRRDATAIDFYAVMMIDELKGFESSLPSLLSVKDLSIWLLPAVHCLFLRKGSKDRAISISLYTILFSTFFHFIGVRENLYIVYGETGKDNSINIFSSDSRYFTYFSYVPAKEYSIQYCFAFDIIDLCNYTEILSKKPWITVDDVCVIESKKKLNEIFDNDSGIMVLILVESMESWVVNDDLMPNLYSFMQNHPHFFAKKIKDETRSGLSADGQLILLTGMQPLRNGMVTKTYFKNKFPSLMNTAGDSTLLLLPHDTKVYNQENMNLVYGINYTQVLDENDEKLFGGLISGIKSEYKSILLITMSTHTPYSYYSTSQYKISLPDDMPSTMKMYVGSFSCLDKALSSFLKSMESDSLLSNMTVAITGDHTTMVKELLTNYQQYCNQKGLDYDIEPFCPLIIFSPSIKETKVVTDTCYQTDCYPTILHAAGRQGYWWQGFGCNLLDSVYNRPYSEERILDLSDKIIRNDYFAK